MPVRMEAADIISSEVIQKVMVNIIIFDDYTLSTYRVEIFSEVDAVALPAYGIGKRFRIFRKYLVQGVDTVRNNIKWGGWHLECLSHSDGSM